MEKTTNTFFLQNQVRTTKEVQQGIEKSNA